MYSIIKVAIQSACDATQSFAKTKDTQIFENNKDSINHKSNKVTQHPVSKLNTRKWHNIQHEQCTQVFIYSRADKAVECVRCVLVQYGFVSAHRIQRAPP